MNPKQRVTLDGADLRLRPRTYADSHVPKRVAPRLMNDISTPYTKQVTSQPSGGAETPVISTQHIAVTARNMLDQRRSTKIEDESVAAHAESIGELVSTIQQSRADIGQSINFESSLRNTEQEVTLDKVGVKKSKLRHVFKAVHALDDRRSIIMSAVAVFLVVGGLVALFSSVRSSRLVTMQVQALSEKSSQSEDFSSGQGTAADVPSEDIVPESVISGYSVAPDLPRYISIPKLKITRTRVLRMGLDKEEAIKTPRNVWDTGWYDGSSKPSESTGAALIVGHVSGPTNGGVFYNLYRLSMGDEIQVTQGDGTVLTYKVISKEEVPADGMNMNNYLVSKNVDKAGLTLMTCAGEYNPKTQTYDKRLAVFAIRTN